MFAFLIFHCAPIVFTNSSYFSINFSSFSVLSLWSQHHSHWSEFYWYTKHPHPFPVNGTTAPNISAFYPLTTWISGHSWWLLKLIGYALHFLYIFSSKVSTVFFVLQELSEGLKADAARNQQFVVKKSYKNFSGWWLRYTADEII